MSSPYKSSLYSVQEHVAAAQVVLGENDIAATVNYLESEAVELGQLDIKDTVVVDTLKSITRPHLEEVKRARTHNRARCLVYPNDTDDRRKNFVSKWLKRSTAADPVEEEIRLFLNVAMDYEDPICARAALPYIDRITSTRIGYSVLFDVMTRIADVGEAKTT